MSNHTPGQFKVFVIRGEDPEVGTEPCEYSFETEAEAVDFHNEILSQGDAAFETAEEARAWLEQDCIACPNCNWKGRTDQLSEAQDLLERLDPGDTVPEGQCPECGALVWESNPLIDAAPDLLEVLKSLILTIPDEEEAFTDYDVFKRLRVKIQRANAAIAKAEGRGS